MKRQLVEAINEGKKLHDKLGNHKELQVIVSGVLARVELSRTNIEMLIIDAEYAEHLNQFNTIYNNTESSEKGFNEESLDQLGEGGISSVRPAQYENVKSWLDKLINATY